MPLLLAPPLPLLLEDIHSPLLMLVGMLPILMMVNKLALELKDLLLVMPLLIPLRGSPP